MKLLSLLSSKSEDPSKQADPLQLKLSWLVSARVGLLWLALLSAFFSSLSVGSTGTIFKYIYTPIIILFALSAMSLLWIRSYRMGWFALYLQLSIDVCIITGAIYVTGGPISPFMFLYLPLVMIAAILSSRNTAFVVSVLSALAYLALVWLMLVDIIPPPFGGPVVEMPTGGVVVQVVGLISAMILVAIATSFLVRNITSTHNLAKKSQRELAELTQRQKVLINGLKDGVIMTQLDNTISGINEAASELLKFSSQTALGKSLPEILKEIDPEVIIPEENSIHVSEAYELELAPHDGEKHIKLSYQFKPILNEDGGQEGKFFIFQDVTKLRTIEEQLDMQERMARLLKESPLEFTTDKRCPNFVGESPAMKEVFEVILRAAPSMANILICGESGTGKELVARSIHLNSTRSDKPFIPVNCGAIPENLIESELFGHVKGSFTGASADHEGLFRIADGGTIFLDEIGELPIHMQVKLLRVIQERQIRPVGSDVTYEVDIRVIAATNKDLAKEVSTGDFREDLYYRLNVISMNLPPLRDRKGDLPLLVNSILQRLVGEDDIPIVPATTLQMLQSYDYPGNVRELENILERAYVLGGYAILPEHLPDQLQNLDLTELPKEKVEGAENLPVNLDELLCNLEKQYLETALKASGGAKKDAAKLLGINFRSLRYRLDKFSLS